MSFEKELTQQQTHGFTDKPIFISLFFLILFLFIFQVAKHRFNYLLLGSKYTII